MSASMIINGTDAGTAWGVVPAPGFMAALLAPAPLKTPVQTEIRFEHGTRTRVIPKLAKRDITMELSILANNPQQFLTRYNGFISELHKGNLDIETDAIPDTVFHCRFVSATQFSHYSGLAKIILKLEEPNPANRT